MPEKKGLWHFGLKHDKRARKAENENRSNWLSQRNLDENGEYSFDELVIVFVIGPKVL